MISVLKLTAPASYSIIEYILENPTASQIEIAKHAHVSRSMVNYIVRDLSLRGVVSQSGKGRMRLQDPLKLLEALSFERPLKSLIVEEFHTEQSDVKLVEHQIRNAADKSGSSYAFTCFSALSKYINYYLTYPTVHAYSDKPKELRSKITEGRGAVNVKILEPDIPQILKETHLVDGLKIEEPVQTVIDLFCLGEEGRDGAMKLYEEVTKIEPTLKQ